jgi:hypothetical protein
VVDTKLTVCGAFDSASCSVCNKTLTTDVVVTYNEVNIRLHTHFKVVDVQHYDIIFGYLTIQENPLLLRTMFLPEQLQAALNPVVKTGLVSENRLRSMRRDGAGSAAEPGSDQPTAPTHRPVLGEQPKRVSFDAGKQV